MLLPCMRHGLDVSSGCGLCVVYIFDTLELRHVHFCFVERQVVAVRDDMLAKTYYFNLAIW